jgi:hypothetical protein
MTLLNRLFQLLGLGGRNRLTRLAHDIAQTSKESVWRRVIPQSLAMRPAEASGYIRARSAVVVGHHVNQILRLEDGLPRTCHDDLVRLATAEVVRLVIRDWIQARSVSPAAERKAA